MPNKKGNATPKRGGKRHPSDKVFRRRLWSAIQRALGLALLAVLHRYVVDPAVATMFTEGTLLASSAHGFANLSFYGAYIRLVYEVFICFWD